LLRVANLRKTYDSAHQPYVALDGVDVEITDGEFFCLLGPSAAASRRYSTSSRVSSRRPADR
jgi:ABC-type sugar transport system ATPase subunit